MSSRNIVGGRTNAEMTFVTIQLSIGTRSVPNSARARRERPLVRDARAMHSCLSLRPAFDDEGSKNERPLQEMLFQQAEKILAVAVFRERLRERLKLRGVDPALLKGDFLGATQLEALPLFDRGDEMARVEQ